MTDDTEGSESPSEDKHYEPNAFDKVRAAAGRAKNHVVENKTTYLIAAGGVAVGVISTVAFMHGRQIVINDSFNFSLHSPKTNEVITTLIRRGHPGNLIKCNETGEVFASQNRAAAVLGLNAAHLSQYFRGQHEHVKGYTFTFLGEAA